MQPIKLEESHKEKLLEMCRVLFPGYDEYTFWNSDFIGMYNTVDGEETLEDNISIHWFEFCAMTLFDKVIELLDRQTNGTGLSDEEEFAYSIMNKHEHPVNYLYERFKEIK